METHVLDAAERAAKGLDAASEALSLIVSSGVGDAPNLESMLALWLMEEADRLRAAIDDYSR